MKGSHCSILYSPPQTAEIHFYRLHLPYSSVFRPRVRVPLDGGIVISYLDILRKGETGLLWIGTASSLEDANSQIRARASDAGEFVIFNSRTGDRISVWPVYRRAVAHG
jgi:hypothetical protein